MVFIEIMTLSTAYLVPTTKSLEVQLRERPWLIGELNPNRKLFLNQLSSMVLTGCGFTQADKRRSAGPVLAIPFWGQPAFVFRNYSYAALVAIVHRQI
jgi:hypothetical protein